MEPSALQAARHQLAYELIAVLYRTARQFFGLWHRDDLFRIARKIAGYVTIGITVALAAGVILSAPLLESETRPKSTKSDMGHEVAYGLHIALPADLRHIAIEQLLPLP